ncbi:unnamed protein product, partial [marine sediment metagenome]
TNMAQTVAADTVDPDSSIVDDVPEAVPVQAQIVTPDITTVEPVEEDPEDPPAEEDPVNNAPESVDDSYTTNEDVALTITAADMLSNDSDIDGDSLTIENFTQPEHGTVVDNGDGTFTYTAEQEYNGSDNFTYSVSDGNGGTDTATVNLTVTPYDPPKLIVGDNTANDGPEVYTPADGGSITPHADEILQGADGNDVILGDVGGAGYGANYESQNSVLILDRSGSMSGTRMDTAKAATLDLAQKYATYAAEAFTNGADITVQFTVIPFSTKTSKPLTVQASSMDDLTEISP